MNGENIIPKITDMRGMSWGGVNLIGGTWYLY